MTIIFRKHGESPKVYCNIEAEGRYLDLEQLGKVLSQLYKSLPGMGGTCYIANFHFSPLFTQVHFKMKENFTLNP